MQGGIMSDINQSVFHENSLGALAYVTFAPAVYFLLVTRYKKIASVRFHAWQSLEINVILLIVTRALAHTLAFGVPAYMSLISTAWVSALILAFWCGMNALHGKRRKLPLLGALAETMVHRHNPANPEIA
jgi:uncharacterized membrane protein